MTQRDRRGRALIAKHGSAKAVPFRGYWGSGGYRISQTTVRRLIRLGYARPCPDNPESRVLPTDLALRTWSESDLPATWEADYTQTEPVVDRGPDRDGYDFDEIGWSPPDQVVPLDKVFRKG